MVALSITLCIHNVIYGYTNTHIGIETLAPLCSFTLPIYNIISLNISSIHIQNHYTQILLFFYFKGKHHQKIGERKPIELANIFAQCIFIHFSCSKQASFFFLFPVQRNSSSHSLRVDLSTINSLGFPSSEMF